MTGYPSIDRPWLKYYSKEAIEAPLPEGSLYDYMISCNSGHLDDTALNYFGRKISYEELIQNINMCASALIASGVKSGDMVNLCMVAMPETVYLMYAINMIGAVSNMVVLNTSEEEMKQQISNGGKISFAVDIAVQKYERSAYGSSIENIVSIPLHSSMPFPMRTVIKLGRGNDAGLIPWERFLKRGESVHPEKHAGQKDELAFIVYTGGTTGETKGAMISNGAANAIAFQYMNAKTILHFSRKQSFLDVLPPFIAFGIFFGIHMPLCMGFENIVVPDPAPKSFVASYIKFRPNHFCTSPLHIDMLLENKRIKNMDMSFTYTVSYGGDKASGEWEKRITDFLDAHGVPYPISKGYGLTEVASAFCISSHEMTEMIPLPRNNVKIIDIDTNKELGYGQEGEICVSGPSLMQGYWDDEGLTQDKIWVEDGIRWFHTGDLGYMTKEGFFVVSGRLKRVYWRLGPDNAVLRVYPMAIEQVLDSHPKVVHSAVIGQKNETDGYRSIAYIVPVSFEEAMQTLSNELIELCRQKLPPIAVPCEVRILKELPVTRSGKVDFRTLERMAEEDG